MYLQPYFQLFPEQAEAETRSITILRDPVIPPDDYALFDFYCTDPTCDCQRVMINVVGRKHPERLLAAISYAFRRRDPMPGPFLDPLNPRCEYADALLALVAGQLADREYLARLKRHYRQVKELLADRAKPARRAPPRRAARVAPRSGRSPIETIMRRRKKR